MPCGDLARESGLQDTALVTAKRAHAGTHTNGDLDRRRHGRVGVRPDKGQGR